MVVCDSYQLYGRENLSLAGSTLQQELGLNATQLGVLFSAFYFNKIVVKRNNLSQIMKNGK